MKKNKYKRLLQSARIIPYRNQHIRWKAVLQVKLQKEK